jgi:hypothetical protein
MIPRIGGAILVVTAVLVANTLFYGLLFGALGVSLVRGGRDR